MPTRGKCSTKSHSALAEKTKAEWLAGFNRSSLSLILDTPQEGPKEAAAE